MIKRIIVLVVASSLISAGLLFLGTTLMGKFSPALAFSQNAIVAGTNVQTPTVSIQAEEKVPQKTEVSSEAEKTAASTAVKANPATGTSSAQPTTAPIALPSRETPIKGVTIAQLLNNPDQFTHKIFNITGIVTSLGAQKILLNDGTGQILVEMEDDLVRFAALNGLSIMVTGRFDDSSGQNGYKLDAYTLTDKNGTLVVDDCVDDDCNDDCIDDSGDDSNDDNCDDCLDDSDNDSSDDESED
jgi:hypothetical protein